MARGWTAWELDTRAGNFLPNMAVVVCKGVFHDAPDPQLQNKVGHFMTIARVTDCFKLLPFDQLHEAFNSYNEAATTVGLVRLHRSNMVFPDVYYQFYSEHFTIMGLLDPEIRFYTADEFVGGYLVCWHVASSGGKLTPCFLQVMCKGPHVPGLRPRTPTGRAVPELQDSTHPFMSYSWLQLGESYRAPAGSVW